MKQLKRQSNLKWKVQKIDCCLGSLLMDECETVERMTSITVTLTSADSFSNDEETRILSTHLVPVVVRIPSDSISRSSRNGNSQDYYNRSISQEDEEEEEDDDSYSSSYYWAGINWFVQQDPNEMLKYFDTSNTNRKLQVPSNFNPSRARLTDWKLEWEFPPSQ